GGCLGSNWRGRAPGLTALEPEAPLKRRTVCGKDQPLVWHVVPDKIANKGARDAELHVGFEVGIVGGVDLRNEGFEPGLMHHEVKVRRPQIVPTRRPYQFADGAVDRHRITRWFDAAELKAALTVGAEAAAQVHAGLVGVLILIKAVRGRMPDVDFGFADRPTRAV